MRASLGNNKAIGLCHGHYSLLENFEEPHIKCPLCFSFFANFHDLTTHLQKSNHPHATHSLSLSQIKLLLDEVKQWRKPSKHQV